jgi:hypothetical protein
MMLHATAPLDKFSLGLLFGRHETMPAVAARALVSPARPAWFSPTATAC